MPIGTLEQVWIDLRAGGGLGALIEGLVGAFGTSLTRLPEFGVIALSADGEVRVAMRGQVSARLWMLGEDEPTLVNGAGVTTWNERLWSGVGRAELMVAEPGGELLPVVDGIALASLINVAILDFDTQPPVEVASAPPAQIPVPPIKMPLAEPDSQPASPSEPERRTLYPSFSRISSLSRRLTRRSKRRSSRTPPTSLTRSRPTNPSSSRPMHPWTNRRRAKP